MIWMPAGASCGGPSGTATGDQQTVQAPAAPSLPRGRLAWPSEVAFTLGQWLSARGVTALLPHARGHLQCLEPFLVVTASGGGFSWHLGRRDQGFCSESYTVQARPTTRSHPNPNVQSARIRKPGVKPLLRAKPSTNPSLPPTAPPPPALSPSLYLPKG